MEPKRLVPSLLVELYRVEHSTCRHSMRESSLIGNVPPGTAARVIAAHASLVLDDLVTLAKKRDISLTTLGSVVGDAWRYMRDVVRGPFLDLEHSYRETLLGAREGIDLVRLLRSAAVDDGDDELVAWCDRWLPTRTRLVREAADELEWMAKHPAFAQRHAIPVLGAKPLPA